MNIATQLWGCGRYARGAVVCYIAAPVVAAGGLIGSLLLLADVISPSTYPLVGRPFVYGGIALLVFGTLCIAAALQRGELRNISGGR